MPRTKPKAYLSMRQGPPQIIIKPPIIRGVTMGKWLYFTLHCDEVTARHKVQQINNDIELGRFDPAEYFPQHHKLSKSLSEFIADFLKHREGLVKANQISKMTYLADANSLRVFAGVIAPTTPMIAIGREAYQIFVDELIKSGKHQNTSINGYRTHLRAAWSWAVDRGYAKENPFKGTKNLKEPKPQEMVRFLMPDEIAAIRAAFADAPPLQLAAVNFALVTGVRAKGIVEINHNSRFSSSTLSGHTVESISLVSKGRKKRTIPLSKAAVAILDDLRAMDIEGYISQYVTRQARDGARRRAAAGYAFFAFSRPDSVSQMFSRRMYKHRIKATFHNLRDTFASNYIANGGRLEILSKILGHEDQQTTLRRYVAFLPQTIAENIDDLTRL